MNIQEYMELTFLPTLMGDAENPYKCCYLRPLVVCNDGFHISVQAGHTHYCSPRQDIGPHESVELGYPNESDELILEYAEDPEEPTNTVYPYVPMSVIDALIEKHGGLTDRNMEIAHKIGATWQDKYVARTDSGGRKYSDELRALSEKLLEERNGRK